MKFLTSDFWGGPETTAIVTLDCQANVMLMGDAEFSDYRAGRPFHYYGGLARHSPVRLSPPHHGHWHVVIDLGGYGGVVRAAVKIIAA